MAVIACPGCGLPRADDQIAVVPCPVCSMPTAVKLVRAPLAKTATADPTVTLPADVSQMEAQAKKTSERLHSRLLFGLVFVLGIALCIGGLLAWQQPSTVGEAATKMSSVLPQVAAIETPLRAKPVAIAPRPRVKPPELAPEPKPVIPSFPLLPAVVFELDEPDRSYTVEAPTMPGEHIVLRGKVRMLQVSGLDGGALLDASALEAGSIYVEGKIDGRSVLKLSAVNGVIAIPASVSGKSRVEINAPGSEVRFPFPTTANRPGSLIDGGSTVTITARTVDLRGDVDGVGTRVAVTLTRNGSLKVAAIRGTAAVEYRPADPRAPAPSVAAFSIAPTATFRQLTE